MTIYSRQSDVTSFYNTASLVISLTNPLYAIETFGLTTLEAMTNGLPVIVPTQGGIAEMVENGVNGYKTDIQNLKVIKEQILLTLESRDLYIRLSSNAKFHSDNYNSAHILDRLINSLDK